MLSPPHPIPYQGSKRKLAPKICKLFPKNIDTLIEPFCGSAAITLFSAQHNLAKRFLISDKQPELVELLFQIINKPDIIIREYTRIWNGYIDGDTEYFNKIRDKFNIFRDPADLLYLIVRCVKNAIRFNSSGNFTQSADKRRRGTNPKKITESIHRTSLLLKNKTKIMCNDFQNIIKMADNNDFIYMDPPYYGTSLGKDKRYFSQVIKEDIIKSIEKLNKNKSRFILSYDGITGDIEYTMPFSDNLMLRHFLIDAGISSQSILNGKRDSTFESLYLSENINKNIIFEKKVINGKEYLVIF